MKSIGVFCGSSSGGKEIYKKTAIEFGELLARKNITLVFGAGNIGLMGHIADSVLNNKGKTIGVIPKLLTGREITHEGSTETHIVETMSERKELIMEISDAFVAMPGGFGPFDELTEVLTHYQLDDNPKKLLDKIMNFAPIKIDKFWVADLKRKDCF